MNLLLLLLLQDKSTEGTTEGTTTEADQQIGFLTESLTKLLSHITVNMWLQALIVVAASLLLAKLFDWLCTGVLRFSLCAPKPLLMTRCWQLCMHR